MAAIEHICKSVFERVSSGFVRVKMLQYRVLPLLLVMLGVVVMTCAIIFLMEEHKMASVG